MKKILFFVLFTSTPSWGAVVLSTYTACATNACTTPGADTTGATLLIVGQSCATTRTCATPPTDSKANGWTALTTQTGGTSAEILYYSTNPIVGTGHTFTTTSNAYGTCVMAFSGVDTAANPVDVSTGTGRTLLTTISADPITPTQDNEVIVTHYGIGTVAALPTVDAGMTVTNSYAYGVGVVYQQGCAYIIQTTAAAIDPTWTINGTSTAGYAVVSFKAAAAVATTSCQGILGDGIVCGSSF